MAGRTTARTTFWSSGMASGMRAFRSSGLCAAGRAFRCSVASASLAPAWMATACGAAASRGAAWAIGWPLRLRSRRTFRSRPRTRRRSAFQLRHGQSPTQSDPILFVDGDYFDSHDVAHFADVAHIGDVFVVQFADMAQAVPTR